MISLTIFEGPFKLEIQRILIAFTILLVGNITYLFLTKNMKHFTNNKMAYLSVWITIAFVLGVSLVYSDSKNQTEPKCKKDYHYNNAKRDFVYLGILVSLLIYLPVFGWLKSVKNITTFQFIYFSAFGIIISALSSLFTYIISTKNNLHPDKNI